MRHYYWGSGLNILGHTAYILTADDDFSYFWHPFTGKWCRWAFDADIVPYVGGLSSTALTWENIIPIMSFNCQEGAPAVVRFQFINGELGKWTLPVDNAVISDFAANNNPNVYLKFPTWDAGTERKKRIHAIRVITEPRAAFNFSPLNVTLNYAKYDKTTGGGKVAPDTGYTTSRTIDLITEGAKVNRLGTAKRWSFALDWATGQGPISIVKGLEIEYELVGV